MLGYGDVHENYRKHRSSARAALRIDEHHAGGNSALGWATLSSEYDWPEAEFRYKRAIAADPNEISAYIGLAYLSAALGRKDEAFGYSAEILRRDPHDQRTYYVMAVTRAYSGDSDEALECVQRALELRSSSVVTLIDGVLFAGFARRLDLADEWAERATGIAGRTPHALSFWSVAHGYAGDREFGERLLAEIEEKAKTESVLASDVAFPLAALGHLDRALDALERAVAAQEPNMIWLGVSPVFEPLRAHPRFQALLRKMDFPQAAGHD
jgi:tetratricopeptide (TPR) repeat protein